VNQSCVIHFMVAKESVQLEQLSRRPQVSHQQYGHIAHALHIFCMQTVQLDYGHERAHAQQQRQLQQ
jgi:hypothetical protein